MDLGLKHKRVLVTGASSGIGLAIAEGFVLEGADVVIASRNSAKLKEAVELIKGSRASSVSAITLDLASEDQLRQAIPALSQKHCIDVLVYNVGGPAAGRVLELAVTEWDRGYQSLLRGCLVLTELVVPSMKKQGWGRILTVTSTSAREIIPGLSISSTFRAGLSAWTKSLAKEVGRYGILVNNLLPGPTNTARLTELAIKNPDFFETVKAESAVGRIAEPVEIARVALFLCSAANTYVTGTNILADGGCTKAV